MYLVEALNYVETIERMEKLKTIEQWVWSAHFSHCTTYLHLNKELPQNSTYLLHSNYKLIYVHLKTNKSILLYVTLHHCIVIPFNIIQEVTNIPSNYV